LFNDLLGLQYQWGAHPSDGSGLTDCFALSMEIRRRLGLHDFYAEFQWVYKEYGHEGVSAKQIIQWMRERSKIITEPRNGALFRHCSPGRNVALATVIDDFYAILLGPSQRVIVAPLATVAKGKFYWAD
jgi:hypothetical protein